MERIENLNISIEDFFVGGIVALPDDLTRVLRKKNEGRPPKNEYPQARPFYYGIKVNNVEYSKS